MSFPNSLLVSNKSKRKVAEQIPINLIAQKFKGLNGRSVLKGLSSNPYHLFQYINRWTDLYKSMVLSLYKSVIANSYISMFDSI
jgi:hypothetical protein